MALAWSLLANIGDLHHLGMFATRGVVHFENVLVGTKDAIDLCRCLVLLARHRTGVTASESDDFAATVGVTFAYDHRGAHVVNPDAAVLLSDVVVTGEADSMEGLAHNSPLNSC